MSRNKLILNNLQKPRSPGSKDQLAWVIKFSLTALLCGRVLAVLLMGALPSSAHAGVFSFVTGMFGGGSNSEETTVVTSQSITLLQAALNPNPNPAKGGGDITVVGDTALLSETGPSGTMVDIEEGQSDQISLYVVRDGDTLSGIAKMYGVSVNTIMWANDVNSKTLKTGERLVILPISGIQHVVKNGDTLKGIALKYKADVDEIIHFNSLIVGQPLVIGTNVIIPDGEAQSVPAKASPRSTARIQGAGGPNYVGFFAKPIASYTRTQGLHGYNGVDLGAPTGTPVTAAAAGEVIVSKNYGWNGGYGQYIVIAHSNGTQTLYSHMSETITYPGMRVIKGQVVGYVGSTGKSTGPHLHFEVRGAKNPF